MTSQVGPRLPAFARRPPSPAAARHGVQDGGGARSRMQRAADGHSHRQLCLRRRTPPSRRPLGQSLRGHAPRPAGGRLPHPRARSEIALEASPEQLHEAVESLQRFGFVNYFGMQRFGSSRDAATHVVGRAMLRADWEAAVALILSPRRGGRRWRPAEC